MAVLGKRAEPGLEGTWLEVSWSRDRGGRLLRGRGGDAAQLLGLCGWSGRGLQPFLPALRPPHSDACIPCTHVCKQFMELKVPVLIGMVGFQEATPRVSLWGDKVTYGWESYNVSIIQSCF